MLINSNIGVAKWWVPFCRFYKPETGYLIARYEEVWEDIRMTPGELPSLASHTHRREEGSGRSLPWPIRSASRSSNYVTVDASILLLRSIIAFLGDNSMSMQHFNMFLLTVRTVSKSVTSTFQCTCDMFCTAYYILRPFFLRYPNCLRLCFANSTGAL